MKREGTHRNTLNARRRKEFLFNILGRYCISCFSTKNLRFDHIAGRNYNPRDLSYLSRLRRYMKEVENLQVLCEECNNYKKLILLSDIPTEDKIGLLKENNIQCCHPEKFIRPK